MRKLALVILLINALTFIYAEEILKIKDIRNNIKSIDREELINYFMEIENKKVEKETGHITNVIEGDATNDIILVEMDRPKINNLRPDLFFYLDKRISSRLSELQMIYFDAKVVGYDLTLDMIEVSDVYLSGIMR